MVTEVPDDLPSQTEPLVLGGGLAPEAPLGCWTEAEQAAVESEARGSQDPAPGMKRGSSSCASAEVEEGPRKKPDFVLVYAAPQVQAPYTRVELERLQLEKAGYLPLNQMKRDADNAR